MRTPLRVAVCEDSPSYALALTRLLEADGGLRVVGTYGSGEELLEALPSLDADLVTMDLDLPGMDGVTATERVMAAGPLPIVVVSGHTARGGRRAAAALAAGAVDVVHKQDLSLADTHGPVGESLRRRLRSVGRVGMGAAAAGPPPRTPPTLQGRSAPPLRTTGIQVVGVAASTGGPAALRALLLALPAEPALPLLVVQHMTPGFTAGLVGWLGEVVAVPVRLAEEGALATPAVWVAPDGAHLVVDRRLRLHLDAATDAGRHRPAADVLFASMARELGPAALAVVLTGMGRDGAVGVEALVRAGGQAIAQDETDAVLAGMPHAAVEAGAMPAGTPRAIGAQLAMLRSAGHP
jgi:two-component system chemotaxis response regulator CheB